MKKSKKINPNQTKENYYKKILGFIFAMVWFFMSLILYGLFLLINLNIPDKISFFKGIPNITLPILISIFTLFVMIVSLSFNINQKLPWNIIRKYILKNNVLLFFLYYILGLFSIELCVLLFGGYNNLWGFVFIIAVVVAVFMSVSFLSWFLESMNKHCIYSILEKNLYAKIKTYSQRDINTFYNKLKSQNNNLNISFEDKGIKIIIRKKGVDKTIDSYIDFFENPQLNFSIKIANKTGILKINLDKLKQIFIEYNGLFDHIYSISIFKPGIFVSKRQEIFKIIYNKEKEKEIMQFNNEFYSCFSIISVQDIEEINDWFEILLFSLRKSDFKEDFVFFREFVRNLAKGDALTREFLKLIINNLENLLEYDFDKGNIFLKELIYCIYDLRKYISEKNSFSLFLFNLYTLKKIFQKYAFLLKEEYTPTYANSIFYLHKFLDYNFINDFYSETDSNKLNKYKIIFDSNLDFMKDILYTTIEIYPFTKHFSSYLKTNMSDFVSYFELVDTDFKYHNEDKNKIIDTIIRTKRKYIIEISMYILYLIDNERLPKNILSLVFEFLSYSDFFNTLENINDDVFFKLLYPEGVMYSNNDHFLKYICVYLIYLEKENKITLKEYEKLRNTKIGKKLLSVFNKYDSGFFNKWFDLSNEKIDYFIKNIKQNLE